ncbi:aminopeptidase P family protein [Methyloferula stellata]|uniref:aminopeptidase P family protein n=1 Tax=Methyloferula stellata TaxID=876270 RepID=UPI00035C58EC|nr:aminopeptidase P family protein [Methyloferula stellata]
MFEALYQTFEDSADSSQSAERVAALRSTFRKYQIDGYLIPRADRHQNEYVAPADERLAWLSGFTGSAGLAIVLRRQAVLFIDGRYTLAVQSQIDPEVFEPVALAQISPDRWLETKLRKGSRIGYDPWLHTPGQIARYAVAAAKAGAELVAVEPNLIDLIWTDRPKAPQGEITVHPPRYAGEASAKKLARIVATLGSKDALVVSDPHAVAWAFNIRGQDVSHTPLPLSFAIITRTGKPKLYVDFEKLDDSVRAKLKPLAALAEPKDLKADLQDLAKKGKSVLFDAGTAPAKLIQIFEKAGGHADVGTDPIALMKAKKNATELEGMRQAHIRDAAAMVSFLHWFEGEAAEGELTEIEAAQALETFRRDTKKLKDVSFPSISASGPHSAIPHYRVTEKTNRKIKRGIFLIDSGAQYQDGTTDITRTVAVGEPNASMRDRFTRVLKGHIAIARAVFPKGTSGAQIDALARLALWQAGLDFDHGTGHGVGSYLSVHEGPQRIAKVGMQPLEPGMILSNEPGYYNAGHWGIRIENLVIVEPREIAGAERESYGFETITLVPIDRNLIEPKLLNAEELDWINAYHARVRKIVSPLVEPAARKWLKAATQPIE